MSERSPGLRVVGGIDLDQIERYRWRLVELRDEAAALAMEVNRVIRTISERADKERHHEGR
jgi:hypothetical protein